jgi:O-antigen ligase
VNILRDESRLLQAGLVLWAATTLSFMAGMSIGSGIFFACALFCFARRPETRRGLRWNGLATASVAFAVAALLSVCTAIAWPPLGLPLERFGGLQKLHFFLIPFFAAAALEATSVNRDFERHPLWRALLVMGLLVSVIGIFQFWAALVLPAGWLDNPFFRVIATGGTMRRFHAQGLMYFHLSYASALSFVVAWAGARALWPPKGQGRGEKNAWLLLAVLASFALFYSFSRIAWFALAAIPVVLGFLKRPRAGLLTLLGVIAAGAVIFLSAESLRGRLATGWQAIGEREGVWAGAVEMIRDRPLTGVGFGKTGYYSKPYATRALGHEPVFTSHAHDNTLDILAATGVVGFLAYAAWWGVLLLYAFRAFRDAPADRRWLPAGALAGWVAFQINGLTQVNFFDAKSQHSLMLWAGIVLALEARRAGDFLRAGSGL